MEIPITSLPYQHPTGFHFHYTYKAGVAATCKIYIAWTKILYTPLLIFPTAKIEIRPIGEGLSIYAPSHGLHEVYFDKNSWKVNAILSTNIKHILHFIITIFNALFDLAMQVKVVDWMKGQTCGLCGKADGEVRQEYITPNGRLTKNPVSYAHSWVLTADSCRDTTGEIQFFFFFFIPPTSMPLIHNSVI